VSLWIVENSHEVGNCDTKWAEHVTRIGETKNSHRILADKRLDKRQFEVCH